MAPVALLTGASSGIGYAVADRLAREGHSIALCSRQPDAAAARLAREHGVEVTPVPGDLADAQTARACIEAVKRLGGLDALLLNHGGPPVKPFADISEEEWERAFKLMMLGPLRLLRQALPLLRDGGGRVAAITSLTVKSPLPGATLSNALRAGLLNALKTAAQEEGAQGVLINCVAPGYTLTERLESFNEAQASRRGITREEVDAEVLAQIPLRRYGEPAEVADTIAFFLSPLNGYITGQQLVVDGGLVMAT